MKIQTITNVEFSSICNLACEYCPASQVGEHRSAMLMEDDVFEATLDWIQFFVQAGSQREINLFGIGESTLHPKLPEFVRRIRAVTQFTPLRLNTNGILLTKALGQDLKDAGISDIHITDHDARATVKALQVVRDLKIPHHVNRDFSTGANNWAGLVDWTEKVDYVFDCNWILRGQVMIMSRGQVATCCVDAFGDGLVGHVQEDDLSKLELVPFDLCKGCHHEIPGRV